MGLFTIFAIRLILSFVFAFLITRLFFQDMAIIKVFGLAIVMLGLAYLLEFLRKRNKEEDYGK